MKTEIFELYKEMILDGLAGAGINLKDSKLKLCKQLMGMILEIPVELINELEDVYIMSAYEIYLESYWESDLTRWNIAVCDITNGIGDMKRIIEKIKEEEEEDTMTREEMYCELINYTAGDYLDTLTNAEMGELYLELFEKGYLVKEN